MNRLATYLLCVLIVFLPGCGLLSPAQRESGKASLQDAYKRGEITADQRDEAMEVLDGKTFDWGPILQTGGGVLASILLGVPVSIAAVNKRRGPPRPREQQRA